MDKIRIGVSPSKNLVEVVSIRGKIVEERPMLLDHFENAYLKDKQEFVDCVQNNRQPEITGKDIFQGSKMAHLATQSFKEKNNN